MTLSFGKQARCPLGRGHRAQPHKMRGLLSVSSSFEAVPLDLDGARSAKAQTMTKITKRFNMQRAHSGVWSITDMFTGQPAVLDGVLLVGLKLLEADDILYKLNNLDLSDRKAKGIA